VIDAAPPTIDGAAAIDAASVDAVPGPLTPPVPSGKVGIQVLGLEYEGFEAKLLPAIRTDGSQVAAVWVGDDGGRGYLDLKFQLVDARTSKVVSDQRLVDPDETNAALGDDGQFDPAVVAAVKKRVGDVNAFLAAGQWRALDTHTADGGPDAPIVAAGINWSLEDGARLVGTRAGKKVFDKTYAQLTGKKAPGGDSEEDMCPDVLSLSAVHVDEATSQAVVAFGRLPGHNCGAPGDELVVIALPT
jgi:hypothetical protein